MRYKKWGHDMSWRLRLDGLTDLIRRYANTFRVAWRERKSLTPAGFRIEEADFLPAALALKEKPPSDLSRICSVVIVVAVTAALTWSCFGKIDIIATARGKIIPVGSSKIVQSITSGRVKSISVKDGDHVNKGQVLIEIDDAIPRALRGNAQASLSAAYNEYRVSGLLLEKLTGKALQQITFSIPNLVDTAGNAELAEADYKEYLSHLQALRHTEASRRSAAAASRQMVAQYQAAMPLVEQKAADYQNLLNEGYVSKHDAYEKRQQRIDLVGSLGAEEARHAEAEAAAASARADIATFEAQFLAQQETSYKNSQQKIQSALQDIAKADAQIEQARVKAPIDGIVQQLAVHSDAAVANEGQALLTIVPTNAPLQIQADLSNRDVGFVKSGQRIEIKIDAYPYTNYGKLSGKVISISCDSVPDKDSDPKYQVYATIDDLASNNIINAQPGMTATVEIKTGRQRIIDYFLSPIKGAISDSFHER